jgi:hypothetical protein
LSAAVKYPAGARPSKCIIIMRFPQEEQIKKLEDGEKQKMGAETGVVE